MLYIRKWVCVCVNVLTYQMHILGRTPLRRWQISLFNVLGNESICHCHHPLYIYTLLALAYEWEWIRAYVWVFTCVSMCVSECVFAYTSHDNKIEYIFYSNPLPAPATAVIHDVVNGRGQRGTHTGVFTTLRGIQKAYIYTYICIRARGLPSSSRARRKTVGPQTMNTKSLLIDSPRVLLRCVYASVRENVKQCVCVYA